MDVSDFIVTCRTRLDFNVLPGHVGVIQHFINSRQTLGTLRMRKAGSMLQVTTIFNNSSYSRHARLLSDFHCMMAGRVS